MYGPTLTIDDNHLVKISFALSFTSVVISGIIITISSLPNFYISFLGANFLKMLTITFTSITILCHLLVAVAKYYQRRSCGGTKATVTVGRLPRVLPWVFFLLAIMWIVQFSLLTVASGAASKMNSAIGSQSPDSSWHIPAELCLTIFGIVVLAVLGGVQRVRFCREKRARAQENDRGLDRDIEDTPTVSYIKEPPPTYQ